jgi:hypothetical protein
MTSHLLEASPKADANINADYNETPQAILRACSSMTSRWPVGRRRKERSRWCSRPFEYTPRVLNTKVLGLPRNEAELCDQRAALEKHAAVTEVRGFAIAALQAPVKKSPAKKRAR